MAGGWLYHITHRIYWNYWNHNGFLNNPFGYSRSSVLQITRLFHHVKKIQLNPTSLPDYSMALFQMIPTNYSIMVGSIQNLPNVSIPCNQAEAQAAALRRRAQAELRQALRGLLQRGILDGIFRYLVQYSINGAVIYIYVTWNVQLYINTIGIPAVIAIYRAMKCGAVMAKRTLITSYNWSWELL